jgi:hypothetical protein
MVGGDYSTTTNGKASGHSAVNDDDECVKTEAGLGLLILIVEALDDGLLSSDRNSCHSLSISSGTRPHWVR